MLAVSDEQLIQWVADGDGSCLGTLFERHHRAVFQYFRTLTHDNSVSEDLAQDLFLKLLRHAKTYRGQGSFKAWMFCVARNVAFDYLRKRKRRGEHNDFAELQDQDFIDYQTAEKTASNKQQLQLVATALASLPEAVREIIWLGRFEFDNYDELGQAMDCSAGTARVRMHRAMQQLQQAMTQLTGATSNG